MHLEAGRSRLREEIAERVEAAVDRHPFRGGLAAIEVERVAAAPDLHIEDVDVPRDSPRDDGRDFVGVADAAVERVDEAGAPAGSRVLGSRLRCDRTDQQQARGEAADELLESVVAVPGRGCLHTHADAMVKGHLSGCPRQRSWGPACGLAPIGLLA